MIDKRLDRRIGTTTLYSRNSVDMENGMHMICGKQDI